MWTRLKAVRSRRGTFLVQEGNRILGCSGDKPLLTSSRSWRPFSFSPPEVWLAVHQGTQGDAHSIVILGSKQGPRQTSRKSSFPFPSPPRRMPSLGVPSSREVDSWRESPGVTSAQGKVASWGTQGWVGGEEEKGGRSFCLLAMREAAGVEKQGRKLSRRELPQGKEVSSEVWLPRALRDPPPPNTGSGLWVCDSLPHIPSVCDKGREIPTFPRVEFKAGVSGNITTFDKLSQASRGLWVLYVDQREWSS